jgi:hypothetical protein
MWLQILDPAYKFYVDPDFYFMSMPIQIRMLIRIKLLTLMQIRILIRIKLFTLMRIRIQKIVFKKTQNF